MNVGEEERIYIVSGKARMKEIIARTKIYVGVKY
jgi:hypothetical protein